MEETLYRKVGRRYKPVGMEFTGFPADGIWLMLDGRHSLMIHLDEIRNDMPVSSVAIRKWEGDLANYLAKNLNGNFSINDVAKAACDFFAMAADGETKMGERRW